MRVAVPAGYMPMFSGHAITIELCSGYGPMAMTMAMPDMTAHGDKQSAHGKGDTPCGFSGLAVPSLSGADPILLGLAIAFIFAAAFRRTAPVPIAVAPRLRPPSRGPPATA